TLDLDERLVKMAAEGYDAVVRHGAIVDEQVIVKRLALSRRFLVAAPGYLEKFGRPKTLDELKRHRGIVYSHRGAADWRFKAARRFVTVRPETVALRVNNGLLMRGAAVAGLGLALLPRWFIQSELARKQLTIVDVGAEAEGATLYIAYPYDRRGPAKLLALPGMAARRIRTPTLLGHALTLQPAGSSTTKRAPLPGSPCALTRPPCSVTIRRTIASPSPVPLSLVVKYGAKIRSLNAGSNPGPLSSTSSSTAPARARVRTVMRPTDSSEPLDATASRAFSSRLSTTWVS